MKYKFIIFAFSIFLFSSTVASAQEFNVTGAVTDETQNPMPASTLEFINSDGNSVGNAETTYDGSYEIQVKAGTYTVSIEGPDGSGIGKVVYQNQVVSDDSRLDYILGLVEEDSSSIPRLNLYNMIGVFVLVGVVILLGVLIIYKKGRNN